MQTAEKLLKTVCDRITAAQVANQCADKVKLLAVSKTFSAEKVMDFYQLGQRDFGENYIQEWISKKKQLPSDIVWHVIGHVQRNKSKWVANEADWLHTLDGGALATRLNYQRPIDKQPLQVCIEINISGAMQKWGIKINELPMMIEQVLSLPHLCLRGLMCVPDGENPIQLIEQMQQMKELFHQLKREISTVDTLSMGMSNDLELAIAHGATFVRIGSALFGSRQ